MNQNDFNNRLRSEVQQFTCAGREESPAFLLWYLHNIFRIDQQETIDYICDSRNDKGIDGIYVDEDEEEIYLFQSKFSPQDNRGQGDNDLRNFVGAKQWFDSEESVNQLLLSTASIELKSLVTRLKLGEKIGTGFDIYMQFITNKLFDTNAKEFLTINQDKLEGYDLADLFHKYTYIADMEIQTAYTTIVLSNNTSIKYDLPNGIVSRVYPIPVKELLKLEGIQDRTLFYKNVRFGLGNTRVNKEIKKTILNSAEHNNVFLYHNGITIICDTLDDVTPTQIGLQNYSIINGCQSMLTFYENRNKITDNMYVLTKIIKLRADSPLIQQITYFTNNQNAISLKDLKSNDRVQKQLQNEFKELFANLVFYRIKRGETSEGYSVVIDLDFAAQLIEAFYLNNPHSTHLKSYLFGERYSKLFSRHVSAAKIFLAYTIYNVIENHTSLLKNEQIRVYGLAKFFFTYLVGEILRADEKGQEIIENPAEFVTLKLQTLIKSFMKLWELLTPEVNAYLDEYAEQHYNFFDYKNVFKNAEFVRSMSRRIKMDHQRILIRHPEDSFKHLFESFSSNT